MSVLESVGARYVPMFADPIIWDSSQAYEALTIVQHNSDTYVSKKDVPAGILLSNDEYWLLVYQFSAQVAAMRSQIASLQQTCALLDQRVTALENEQEVLP